MMKNDNSIEAVRHSLAHLLAYSVKQVYPGSQNAIGPAVDNGFYQDFEIKGLISEEDLLKIEEKMKEILGTWKGFERREVNLNEALEIFADNTYKQELAREFAEGGKTLTIYTSGDFVDLCKGGHVNDISAINPAGFKIMKTAGAYWRGDEKNIMLTRIYGVAFATPKELRQYLDMLEEAKKRDHRKLGKELDLFTFSDLVGAGLTLWTPRGTILRRQLDGFVQEMRDGYDYQEVTTPHINKKELFEKSGHWAKFAEELFRIKTREGHEFAMKPMSCPMHAQLYAARPRSYKDLPIRYRESAVVYRDEQSGELSGLSRVRSFTQDDAHVFCRRDQIKEEFLKIWDIVDRFYGTLEFPLYLRFSRYDPAEKDKYSGEEAAWQDAESQLKEMIEEKVGTDYTESMGEAAFYGPKLDFMSRDALGREWQVATIQLDFNQPEGFDLTYTSENGKQERIFMIHAAIMGSIDRFLSVLIEHTGGKFPIWLAPEQVRIITVNQELATTGLAGEILQKAKELGVRAQIDNDNESVSKKIRSAEAWKVPYTLVIGEKEIASGRVTPRVRSDLVVIAAHPELAIEDFLKTVWNETKMRVNKTSL